MHGLTSSMMTLSQALVMCVLQWLCVGLWIPFGLMPIVTNVNRHPMFFHVVVILAVLEPSNAPTDVCPLPDEIDPSETTINLSSCGLNGLRKSDIERLEHVTDLYLENNYLKELDSKIFSNNAKLRSVFLGGNPDLIIPKDGCFLVSNSIKLLNLTNSVSCPIYPSSLECLRNLTHLVIVGSSACEETKRLALAAGRIKLKVLCGGSAAPWDPTGPGASLCARGAHSTTNPPPSPPPISPPVSPPVSPPSPHPNGTKGGRLPEEQDFDIWTLLAYVVGVPFVVMLFVFMVLFCFSVCCPEIWRNLQQGNCGWIFRTTDACFQCFRSGNDYIAQEQLGSNRRNPNAMVAYNNEDRNTRQVNARLIEDNDQCQEVKVSQNQSLTR